MKKVLLLAGATLLLTSTGAQAQPYGHDHYDHGPEAGDHGPGPGPGPGGPGGPGGYDHGPDHPQPHHWARGEHVPPEYWHHGHEVDWRAHHLRRPPHGYHWVQADDQYALVGVNTGIVNMVLNIR